MAERALPAFGRYVKMLRERRGLSLDDAAALTRVYPSPLNKGYVSRVERGLTRVGFEKMIAIARAYDVAVDVLAERLWLDLELDTTSPPETAGLGLLELVEESTRAASLGMHWHVYACLRDAVPLGADGPVVPRFKDRTEQIAICTSNLGAAAMRLGALRFALYEMTVARSLLPTGSEHAAMLSVHLANLSRRLGDLPNARAHADRAISESEAPATRVYLGYALASRGVIAKRESDVAAAVDLYQRAIEAFRESDREAECALMYLDIAQAYYDSGRVGAAKRAISTAEHLAQQFGVEHVRIRSRILLGEIEEREGKSSNAVRLWHDAAEMARQLRDRTLLFKADFLIYRRALDDGSVDTARAVSKKLNRLAPWIQSDIPELREFKRLHAIHRGSRRSVRRVAE